MTTKEMSDFLNGLWCWARCTEEEQRKLSEIADYLSSRGNEKNDCISRKRAIERLKLNLPLSDGADNSKDRYRYMQSLADIQAIRELPSVTPQEPVLDKINKMKFEIADSLEFWDYSPNNNPLARDILETVTHFWGDIKAETEAAE